MMERNEIEMFFRTGSDFLYWNSDEPVKKQKKSVSYFSKKSLGMWTIHSQREEYPNFQRFYIKFFKSKRKAGHEITLPVVKRKEILKEFFFCKDHWSVGRIFGCLIPENRKHFLVRQ